MSVAPPRTIDVSTLPDHAFGSRTTLWWATLGITCVETTVFILTIASYFYLQGRETAWPPPGTPDPRIFWATINTAIMIASLVPNQLVKNAAEKKELRKVRIWIIVADLLAIAFLAVRFMEFRDLGVSWDSNAYASITWVLLGFHTFHLLTDVFDSIVLTVMMYTHHGHDVKRMVDVEENAFYWYFVVLAWIPIYLVIYWSPRWL